MSRGAPGSGRAAARCYRACDHRFPFLWSDATQPPGRWHGPGEGPCHYLATTAKGAWAEVLRHEEIRDLDGLLGIECSLWEVHAPVPEIRPDLDPEMLTGDRSSYRACQAEARRIRELGHGALRAPSAALVSGQAEVHGVVGGVQTVNEKVPSETFVIFGTPEPQAGMPLAEGHPDPVVLTDVRHF